MDTPTTTTTTDPTATSRGPRTGRRAIVVSAVLLVCATVAITLLATSNGDAASANATATADAVATVEFDVAENGTRFAFDDQHVFEDGFPAYGNVFVTEGYVLEAGTLEASGGNVIGEDGSIDPAFADAVIGTWTCYGTMVGDGMNTDPEAGAWVVSTQVVEFEDGSTITTAGFENPVGGPTEIRAVVGGTGAYRSAAGEAAQTSHPGFNDSMGIEASFVIEVEHS